MAWDCGSLHAMKTTETGQVEELAEFFTRRVWLRGGRNLHQAGGAIISPQEYDTLKAGMALDEDRMTYLVGFMDGWKRAKA